MPKAFEKNNLTGEVTLRFDGETYTAGPPSFETMLQLEEYERRIAETAPEDDPAARLDATAIIERGESLLAEKPDMDAASLLAEMRAQVQANVEQVATFVAQGGSTTAPRFAEFAGWWRLLFSRHGDKPLPDQGLPIWLGSPLGGRTLVIQALVHFMGFPTLDLGVLSATQVPSNGQAPPMMVPQIPSDL